MNHECPYLHTQSDPADILQSMKEDASKKALFQQCQQLALKLCQIQDKTEVDMRQSLREHRELMMGLLKIKVMPRIVMP